MENGIANQPRHSTHSAILLIILQGPNSILEVQLVSFIYINFSLHLKLCSLAIQY